jgi:hypothetical protein
LRHASPRGIRHVTLECPAMPSVWFNRLMLFFAGLLGAGGVAAASASAHGGGALLPPLALIALTQAPHCSPSASRPRPQPASRARRGRHRPLS